ncbi:MAG: C10 family peptidase [Bacteroidales bacterium]|nr:C10 family peptidase [Bacteroidales bacterium]
MKKNLIYLSIAAFLLAFPCLLKADPVDFQKARKVAENFLKADTRAGGLRLVWDGLDEHTRSVNLNPPFYIFNREGGGWVMIAGEDSLDPIQGYSYDGCFEVEGMPENLAEHMELYKEQVSNARRDGLRSKKDDWTAAMVPTRAGDTIAAGKLLVTALYNQGNPWNLKCPTIDGKHALAGCCAIAQAIIMAYHKYPDAGVGTLEGYSTANYTAPTIVLGHKYDWDNILPRYKSGNYTAEQADAIATLVRDIAIMGRSSFGLSGTGSGAATMCNRVRTYFKYNKGLYRCSHSFYSDEQWFALLKRDIDDGLPVNYASNTHSYVCDGYDSRGYVHFNYGWGGTSNGYYNIAGKTAYGCNVRQIPDPGTESSRSIFLTTSNSNKGIVPSRTTLIKGTAFTVKIGALSNFGFDTYKFEWMIAHVDKDGNIKEIVSDITNLALDYNKYKEYTSVNCLINEDIYLGDKLKAFYRDQGSSGEWIPMLYNQGESFTGEYIITGTPLRKQCSVNYERARKMFTITASDRNLNFKLLDANGNEVPDAIAGRYEKVAVYADRLSAGTYTVQISQKYYVDVMEIKLMVR